MIRIVVLSFLLSSFLLIFSLVLTKAVLLSKFKGLQEGAVSK